MNKTNDDYEKRVTRKPNKKRSLGILGEIQAKVDDDPSKSIRSISRDMGVSYQAGSA